MQKAGNAGLFFARHLSAERSASVSAPCPIVLEMECDGDDQVTCAVNPNWEGACVACDGV
jgi:hypothetical protein